MFFLNKLRLLLVIAVFSAKFFPERHFAEPITVHLTCQINEYSVRMRENVEQNNSEYGHFLRSVSIRNEI